MPHIKFADDKNIIEADPHDKFSTLTQAEQIQFLRAALVDLHSKVVSTGKVVHMLVNRAQAEELARSVVPAAGVKIPGIRG